MVLLCTGLDSELLTNSCVLWLPSDEPGMSGSNPEHVALAERTQALLRKAGLLGPVKPWHELVAGQRS
jgi:hypothetical protein